MLFGLLFRHPDYEMARSHARPASKNPAGSMVFFGETAALHFLNGAGFQLHGAFAACTFPTARGVDCRSGLNSRIQQGCACIHSD